MDDWITRYRQQRQRVATLRVLLADAEDRLRMMASEPAPPTAMTSAQEVTVRRTTTVRGTTE